MNKGKIAVIGGGVIGAGWAARFLLHGYDVALYDSKVGVEPRVNAVIDQARKVISELYDGNLPKPGKLTFAKSVQEAVQDVFWIQENLPERLDIKHILYQEIENHVGSDTLIASSTSGYRPSQLREGAKHPERIFVAHPFNPVYLLPLIELVGLADSPSLSKQVDETLKQIGMFPLHLKKEIDAHIADRLLEAVWRESLWLVKDGIATTEDVDNAIRMGFGLRWAQMGLFETYRIAGGEAGMRHFLDQFGPCLTWPWTKLMDVPEFNDELVDLIAGQSDAQSGHFKIQELESIRDQNLIGFMKILRTNGWGAGKVIGEFLDQQTHINDLHKSSTNLTITRTVTPSWIDYNGHMTESRYLFCASEAADHMLGLIGAGLEYVKTGYSYYTAETHIRHLGEGHLGDHLTLNLKIINHDAKRIHYMVLIENQGVVLASVEQMLLHVDVKLGKSTAAPSIILEKIAYYQVSQSYFDHEKYYSRKMSI